MLGFVFVVPSAFTKLYIRTFDIIVSPEEDKE
jgi:hypothetical protein